MAKKSRTKNRVLALLQKMQDLVATRWFSSEQVQMVAELYPTDPGLGLPVTPRVEILVSLHPRTIDLWNFDNVLKMLPPAEVRSRQSSGAQLSSQTPRVSVS